MSKFGRWSSLPTFLAASGGLLAGIRKSQTWNIHMFLTDLILLLISNIYPDLCDNFCDFSLWTYPNDGNPYFSCFSSLNQNCWRYSLIPISAYPTTLWTQSNIIWLVNYCINYIIIYIYISNRIFKTSRFCWAISHYILTDHPIFGHSRTMSAHVQALRPLYNAGTIQVWHRAGIISQGAPIGFWIGHGAGNSDDQGLFMGDHRKIRKHGGFIGTSWDLDGFSMIYNIW